MSKTITTLPGQTIMDIATAYCGHVDAALNIIDANNIVTTNDPTGTEVDLAYPIVPGTTLTIEESWIDQSVVQELSPELATGE